MGCLLPLWRAGTVGLNTWTTGRVGIHHHRAKDDLLKVVNQFWAPAASAARLDRLLSARSQAIVRSRPLPQIWRGVAGALGALLVAGYAAVIIAPDGHLAFGVESASSAATSLVQHPSATLPRIYALFAGMVAALNPCGFALLPAYLGLYLQRADGGRGSAATMLCTPIKVSLAVATAFVAAFGLVGLAVGAAGAVISSWFPLLGLLVGILLIIGGGAMVSGWTAYGGGQGLADRLGGVATRGGFSGYFAYGVAYALASLGCTLPVFLSVVGSALLAGGWLGSSFSRPC